MPDDRASTPLERWVHARRVPLMAAAGLGAVLSVLALLWAVLGDGGRVVVVGALAGLICFALMFVTVRSQPQPVEPEPGGGPPPRPRGRRQRGRRRK